MRMKREPFTVKLGTNGRQWLEDLAADTETDRSTVARAAFALARRHEPELRDLIGQMKETQ